MLHKGTDLARESLPYARVRRAGRPAFERFLKYHLNERNGTSLCALEDPEDQGALGDGVHELAFTAALRRRRINRQR